MANTDLPPESCQACAKARHLMTCPVPMATLASARIRSVPSPTTLLRDRSASTQRIVVARSLCDEDNNSRKRPAAAGCQQFSRTSALTGCCCRYSGKAFLGKGVRIPDASSRDIDVRGGKHDHRPRGGRASSCQPCPELVSGIVFVPENIDQLRCGELVGDADVMPQPASLSSPP